MTTAPEPLSSINASQQSSPHDVVNQAIENCYLRLRTGIQIMVAKSGLAEGAPGIAEITDEILHNTIETALRIADRFDSTRSAYSWLLGIAVNKLREMRKSFRNESKHFQEIGDEEQGENDQENESGDAGNYTAEECIDAALYRSSNRSSLEDHAPAFDELLSLVNEDDRRVLTLAYVDRLNGVDLAAALGIREGAAYVRVARAKEHLREKYFAIQERKDLK